MAKKQKLSPYQRRMLHCMAAVSLLGAATVTGRAQLLYQEGFNTDGEAANPQRYTTTGRDVYEPARIAAELNRTDQEGPIYWGHNFEVSYAGVPAPTAGRRE